MPQETWNDWKHLFLFCSLSLSLLVKEKGKDSNSERTSHSLKTDRRQLTFFHKCGSLTHGPKKLKHTLRDFLINTKERASLSSFHSKYNHGQRSQ